jgi:hypothetical protein
VVHQKKKRQHTSVVSSLKKEREDRTIKRITTIRRKKQREKIQSAIKGMKEKRDRTGG